MQARRLALAVIAGFVVTGVLSHLLRSTWAVPIYSRYELIWSLSAVKGPRTLAIALGQVLFLLVFIHVYRSQAARFGRRWWRRGLRFGGVMTLLTVVPAVCVQAVLYPVPFQLLAVWIITGGIELVALSLVIAWCFSTQPWPERGKTFRWSTTDAEAPIEVTEVEVVNREIVDAFGRLIPQLSRSAPPPGRRALEEIVRSRATTILVARDARGAILGTLSFVAFRIPTGMRAWIEDVVVDEAARGRGVGEALTRAALARAAQLGARTVELTSSPSRTAANRLYQRLGFATRMTNVYRHGQPQVMLRTGV